MRSPCCLRLGIESVGCVRVVPAVEELEVSGSRGCKDLWHIKGVAPISPGGLVEATVSLRGSRGDIDRVRRFAQRRGSRVRSWFSASSQSSPGKWKSKIEYGDFPPWLLWQKWYTPHCTS